MSVDVCHFGDCRETLSLLADLGTNITLTTWQYYWALSYVTAGT